MLNVNEAGRDLRPEVVGSHFHPVTEGMKGRAQCREGAQ